MLVNALQEWRDLKFEETTHTYKAGGEEFPSVSTILKRYYNEFPFIEASYAKAQKLQRLGEDVTAEDIQRLWADISNEAKTNGHRVHSYGESWPYLIEPTCPQEEAVKDFLETLPKRYVIVSMEQRMYSSVYGYSGTADLILYDTVTSTYLIGDYKTNKNLHKTYGERMLSPFDFLQDCPLSHYYLQLSHYKLLLEEKHYPVSNMFLIHLQEGLTRKFVLYKVLDLSDQLKQLYNGHDIRTYRSSSAVDTTARRRLPIHRSFSVPNDERRKGFASSSKKPRWQLQRPPRVADAMRSVGIRFLE